MNNSELHILDSQFSELIDYFESAIGKSTIQKIVGSARGSFNTHFWYPYIQKYKKWKRAGSITRSVTTDKVLMAFGSMVKSIQVFEVDWKLPAVEDDFLRKLRTDSDVQHLLFELRTGIHLLVNEMDVRWIPDTDDKRRPDLEVLINGDIRAVVECTIRENKLERLNSTESVARDLVKAAKDKLDNSMDWGFPRIIAIKIPEPIDWESTELKSKLDEKLTHWFQSNKLTSANIIQFLGQESYECSNDHSNRKIRYGTGQMAYSFFNTFNFKYELPNEILVGMRGK